MMIVRFFYPRNIEDGMQCNSAISSFTIRAKTKDKVMPWKIRKTSSGAEIVRRDTGKVKSHHASVAMAKKALGAIFANSPGLRNEVKNHEIKPLKK